MTELVQIPEDIREEFSVEADGKVFANSHRGIARLCGFSSNSPIRNILKNIAEQKNLSKPLQTFAGKDFRGEQKIPDVLVQAIVTHYALKGREQAISCMMAFGSIGFRTWFQQQLGWQPETKLEKPMSPAEMFARQAQINLEHEQRLNEHDVEIDKLGNLYNLVSQNINAMNQSRLQVLMSIQQSELLAQEDPSPIPLRKTIWKLVNDFAYSANCLPEEAWRLFYTELRDRYKFDAKTRQRNQGLKFALDAVEQEPGMLENLHKIVSAHVKKLKLPTPRLVDIKDNSFINIENCYPISHSEAKAGDGYDHANDQWYRPKAKQYS